MAESQMFCSIKPFIHCTVTQKQPELVPPRRTPTKEPLGFYSLKSLLLGLFLSVSIHPTAVFSFLIQKISNSQFRLSLSLFIVCLAQVSPWRSLLPQRLAVHSLLSLAPTQSSICISLCSLPAELPRPNVFLYKQQYHLSTHKHRMAKLSILTTPLLLPAPFKHLLRR